MSDTPRTDEEADECGYINHGITCLPASFSRQLERELTQSQQELERVKGELRDCRKSFEGMDDTWADMLVKCRERAESTEAKNKELTAQVAMMGVALQYYANKGHYEITKSGVIVILDSGEVAEKALSNLHPEAEKLVRLVEAAAEFDRGCQLYEDRVDAIANGAQMAIDDLDDIDVEEILARGKVREAYRDLRGDK